MFYQVIGFTRSLSYLKKEQGIRINTLCPAYVETPLVVKNLEHYTGKKVRPGTLVELGMAIHPIRIAQVFMEM